MLLLMTSRMIPLIILTLGRALSMLAKTDDSLSAHDNVNIRDQVQERSTGKTFSLPAFLFHSVA